MTLGGRPPAVSRSRSVKLRVLARVPVRPKKGAGAPQSGAPAPFYALLRVLPGASLARCEAPGIHTAAWFCRLIRGLPLSHIGGPRSAPVAAGPTGREGGHAAFAPPLPRVGWGRRPGLHQAGQRRQ